ncbi:unnamed protein product [Sphenostylis stenocarpa]|uniref:3-beta hydroxysteroid dehydrogenase/isomerase domain-containing protein n=1 Tax=Sphenostylis stenocarpa TaxID=92480 RepID=A0AA86SX62_9FABA|nr:unnamed protein product [Sphenostylis stenocarpa]
MITIQQSSLRRGCVPRQRFHRFVAGSNHLENPNPSYTIHATVFPGSNASHLFTLVDGCSSVFHVASPCMLEDPADPHRELLEPAVQGTLNVLEAARRVGLRRVVLTSSISALVPNPGWPVGRALDEASWSSVGGGGNGTQWRRGRRGGSRAGLRWWRFCPRRVWGLCCSRS